MPSTFLVSPSTENLFDNPATVQWNKWEHLNTDGFYFTELQQNVTDAIMHFVYPNCTQKAAET